MSLLTENEINEWTRKSRKEGICGIVSCFNRPTTQCKKCTNYYCSEHFPSHLDILPDRDFEYATLKILYSSCQSHQIQDYLATKHVKVAERPSNPAELPDVAKEDLVPGNLT
ncbi:MAG: hypothetical protein WBL68_15270 [Nitrososphaeraceae archaeon]